MPKGDERRGPIGPSSSDDAIREPGSAGSRDAEPAHAGLERGPLETENVRGSSLATDSPAHPLKNRKDVIPLDLLEGEPIASRGQDGCSRTVHDRQSVVE
jgi:hypothetical protein